MAETGRFWKWVTSGCWAMHSRPYMAFQCFPDTPLNIVTVSACVADITQRLDRALLKEIDSAQLFSIIKGLWHTIQARDCPCYILRVRSPTNLTGFIVEGNAQADHLASPAWTAPQLDMRAWANASCAFFHQGVQVLHRQFMLLNSEAHNIVNSCPNCQGHTAAAAA